MSGLKSNKIMEFKNNENQKMKKIKILISIMLVLISTLAVSQHFQKIWENNPYMPMHIIIHEASLGDEELKMGDEIGIFDVDENGNEICVGTNIITDSIFPDYLIIITSLNDPTTDEVDGYTPNNEIIYRIWDESKNVEITNIITDYHPMYDSVFVPLETAFLTIEGIVVITQTINLKEGLNLHSFMVEPDSLDMIKIHKSLINENELIFIEDDSRKYVKYKKKKGWVNEIGNMKMTEGYYISVDKDVELEIEGTPEYFSYTIPLEKGWNIMGYPLTEEQNALDALQPILDDLKKVTDDSEGSIKYVMGTGWVNTIGNLKPGEGYRIKMRNATEVTLSYVETETMNAEIENEIEEINNEIKETKVQQNKIYNIFPNPVSERLYFEIEIDDCCLEVDIIDIKGRIIDCFETDGVEFSINMSKFKNGVYLVLIKYENEILKVAKIIKN